MSIDFEKVQKVIDSILRGECKRVDVAKDIKVYSCGDHVIRIDIKH